MRSLDVSGQPSSREERRLRLCGFLHGLVPILLMGAVMIGAAGTVAWPAAWVILGVLLAATALVSFACSPELVMERTYPHEGAEASDRHLVLVLNLVGLLPLLIAGLDHRFRWTGQIGSPFLTAGFILYLLGYCIFSWAMLSNRFFSVIVRVQKEKGHRPVSAGPYHFIRHPGYLGFVIVVLMQPIVLGSLPALIPALVTACLIILRTDREDRLLLLELEGYDHYARQVRFRLVPGIW